MATKKNTAKVKKVDGLSSDVQQEKIDVLKQVAPEVFADGKIDVKKLENLFGADSVADDERYRLEWAGKSQVFDEIAERSSCTLTLDEKRSSKDWQKSNNVFIEGENLEVLRTLQKAYHGKVKMIYIDPPYNTGHDFVYNDNFRESEEEYCDDDCNVDENGLLKKAYKLNSKDGGRFHSNWLSMMYPRLYLARNLLRDDGVIFVSIGDDEVHNLQMMMNEIFGEENFVGKVVWKARVKPVNIGDAKYRPQQETEYVLIYQKSQKIGLFKPLITGGVRSYPHEEDGRKYRLATILKSNRGTNRRSTMTFEIDGYRPPEGQRWQAGEDIIKQLNDTGYLEFRDGVPFKKYFEDEEGAEHDPFYCFMESDWSSTSEAGKHELNNLLGNNHGFDTVKPTQLIKTLIQSCTGTEEDELILDFFAGSGTTAHAVMQQNAEDDGGRKYLCVQIPEETPSDSDARKAGYKKVSEITIDRIAKAAAKIKKENPDHKGDLGVRVYKETESHFPQWHAKAFESDEALEQAMIDYTKGGVGGTAFDRATEVLLKLGYPLTTPLTEEKGYFATSDGVFLVLDQKIAPKDMLKILEEKPKTVVALEKLFKKDEDKINFSLRCKEVGVIFQTV